MTEALERLTAALGERYRIERELGRGGMATVYLAEDLKHRRMVAVKVLRPELAATLGAERFLREIQIAASLTHPHILTLIDSGEAEGFLFYVMPYVEGESLRDRLTRERQLPIDDALRLAAEIADALDSAHSHGVIHRDIKPENILLAEGHAVVADFGIARAMHEAGGEKLTETGLAIGTPHYMSPEQASGSGELDGRSDLYSLGCVLYEMLAGEPPYTGPTPQAVIAKRLSEPVPHVSTLRETVPPLVEGAVTKALARAPVDRFATAAEFAAALRASGSGETVVVRPTRKRRWRVVAAAAAVLSLVVGAAGYALVPAATRATVITLLTRDDATLNPRRIVVAPLDNRTGDTTLNALGDMAADWIAQGLLETAEFEVVDPRTAWATARIVERIPRILRNADMAIAVAEETGSGTVLSGDIYRSGDSLRVQMRVTDVQSGKLVRALDPVSGSAPAPEELIASVRRSAVAAVGMATDTTVIGTMMAQPPFYEAYKEVSRGLGNLLSADLDGALTHLARAIAIDSAYLSAHELRAYVLIELGLWSQADSVARRLQERRDRLTTGERLLLDLMRAELEGDLRGRLRAAQEWLRHFPGSAEAAILVAQAAARINRPREALEALAHTDPARGVNLVSHYYWAWQAAAFHELGEHTRELAAAERGVRRFPGRAHMHRALLRALAALGRVDELETQLASRPQMPPPSPSVAHNPLYASHWFDLESIRELRAHGHEAAARRLVVRTAATLESHLVDTSSVGGRYVRGELLYEAGRWEDARVTFSRLVAEDSSDVRSRGYLGAIAARLGKTVLAERISAELDAIRGPYLFGRHTLGRARIAAILGEKEESVRLLRTAFAEGHPYYHSSNHDEVHGNLDFAALRDYPPFQQLMAPKN